MPAAAAPSAREGPLAVSRASPQSDPSGILPSQPPQLAAAAENHACAAHVSVRGDPP
jgi:hypothetical protein